MEKVISVEEARKILGHLVDDARQRGDLYIISKKGKPSAALVPIHVMEQYQETKRSLLEMIEEIHAKNRDKSSKEIEKLIDEALHDIRKKV